MCIEIMSVRHKKSLDNLSGDLINIYLRFCAVSEAITAFFLMAFAMGREDRGLLRLRP